MLAIGSDAGPFYLRIWDISENRGRTNKLAPSEFDILSVIYSPDGTVVAMAGEMQNPRTWDIKIYDLSMNVERACLGRGQNGIAANIPFLSILSRWKVPGCDGRQDGEDVAGRNLGGSWVIQFRKYNDVRFNCHLG